MGPTIHIPRGSCKGTSWLGVRWSQDSASCRGSAGKGLTLASLPHVSHSTSGSRPSEHKGSWAHHFKPLLIRVGETLCFLSRVLPPAPKTRTSPQLLALRRSGVKSLVLPHPSDWICLIGSFYSGVCQKGRPAFLSQFPSCKAWGSLYFVSPHQ